MASRVSRSSFAVLSQRASQAPTQTPTPAPPTPPTPPPTSPSSQSQSVDPVQLLNPTTDAATATAALESLVKKQNQQVDDDAKGWFNLSTVNGRRRAALGLIVLCVVIGIIVLLVVGPDCEAFNGSPIEQSMSTIKVDEIDGLLVKVAVKLTASGKIGKRNLVTLSEAKDISFSQRNPNSVSMLLNNGKVEIRVFGLTTASDKGVVFDTAIPIGVDITLSCSIVNDLATLSVSEPGKTAVLQSKSLGSFPSGLELKYSTVGSSGLINGGSMVNTLIVDALELKNKQDKCFES